jgi:G:T-mismatch repair DNA endonuclease (very short patch repair protein)
MERPNITLPDWIAHRDHGLELVHDIKGNPRNWLHEVSVLADDEASIAALERIGYRVAYGWRCPKTMHRYKVFQKKIPLEKD